MKIASVHNRYQQPGGEALVAEAERRLLIDAGHQVSEYSRHNDEIAGYGLWGKATLAPRTVWAWDSYREIKALLEKEKPDVAHFHNTFPLISPAPYDACRKAGVPVVQTLHNYRLLCPRAILMREGRVCEDCLGKTFPWPGILHACYRDSYAASATVAAMLGVHNALGTWEEKVDVFIALTEFARQKFIEGGLPADKITVKPNFVHPDPLAGGNHKSQGLYALFVGRLAPEKGLRTMLAAWELLDGRIPLRIVGDGPLRPELEALAKCLKRVSFDGWLERGKVLDALKEARFLVFASEGYETFGLTIVEAFASGLPVIASRLGAVAEIVEDGWTGLHFTPGDAENLAAKVVWAWTHSKETEEMGKAARAEYGAKYTAERNYHVLMAAYKQAMAHHMARQQSVREKGALSRDL